MTAEAKTRASKGTWQTYQNLDTDTPPPSSYATRAVLRFGLASTAGAAAGPPGREAAQREGDAGLDEKSSAGRRDPGDALRRRAAELAGMGEAHPAADFLPETRRRVRLPADVGAGASIERQRRAREAVPVFAVGHREGDRTARRAAEAG